MCRCWQKGCWNHLWLISFLAQVEREEWREWGKGKEETNPDFTVHYGIDATVGLQVLVLFFFLIFLLAITRVIFKSFIWGVFSPKCHAVEWLLFSKQLMLLTECEQFLQEDRMAWAAQSSSTFAPWERPEEMAPTAQSHEWEGNEKDLQWEGQWEGKGRLSPWSF